MVVVVLGMHRSGTSLVAQMLHRLGVNMGSNLLVANRWNRYGYWEDADFVELNATMIDVAGCRWSVPPTQEQIDSVAPWYTSQIKRLTAWKQLRHRNWGWKDPRTALFADYYHPHLVDPRYVFCVRDYKDVIRSLTLRAKEHQDLIADDEVDERIRDDVDTQVSWGESEWGDLIKTYLDHIMSFLERHPSVPHMTVSYEDLRSMPEVLVDLADFVGVDDWSIIEHASNAIGRDS